MDRAIASEGHVLNAIMEYLMARRIFAMRMNTGATKIGDRFVRFGIPGCADILASPQLMCDDGDHRPHFVWIECKAERGRQSELQKSFQAQVEAEGHRYIVARSIEDVEEVLRCSLNSRR